MKRIILFLFALCFVGNVEAQTFQGPIESKLITYPAAALAAAGQLDSIRCHRVFNIYTSGAAFNTADSLFIYSSDTSNVSHGDTLFYVTSAITTSFSINSTGTFFPMGFDISPMKYLYIRFYSQQTTAGRKIIVQYR